MAAPSRPTPGCRAWAATSFGIGWSGCSGPACASRTSCDRHPEALDVELEPPVIVVGLPRSGTTHLVNLLAADSRFRSMPWWEVIEPTPVLGDGPGRDGVDPRYLRCLAAYEIDAAGGAARLR